MKIFALIVFAFSLAGCAVTTQMPGNRFITPETAGGPFQGNLRAHGSGGAEITLVDDKFSSSPSVDPTINENTEIGGGGELGILSFVDAYAHAGTDSPAYYGVKIQLFGSPVEGATKGNFSMAIAGGIATGDEDDTASQNDGAVEAATRKKYKGLEGMVLIGYRPSDRAIVYAGPYYTKVEVEARVTRTESGTSTVTAQPRGEGEQQGILFGFRVNTFNSFYLQGEGSYSETKWTRTMPSELELDEFSETYFGGAVGLSW